MLKIISKYYFYKGVGAFRKREYKLASDIFKNALKYDKNNIRAQLACSVSNLYANNFEESRNILEKVNLNKASAEQKKTYFINYAISLFMLSEKEKAIQILEDEHRKGTFGLLQQTLGYMYIDNQDYDKAYSFISDSLTYDDQDSIFLDNMAQYYYRSTNKDIAKAREYFEKALSINPKQIDTLYFLALYDIGEGKVDDARDKLSKALLGKFSPLNYANPDKINSILDTLK